MNSILRFLLGLQPDYLLQPPPPLTVSVVVPAHNEASCITETLKWLKAQDHPLEQIIVVDDYSSDDTGRIAEASGVQVIRAHENQGSKSAALAYALPHVTGDIFLCVDADTRLAPDAVSHLLRAFSNPKVMISCGWVGSKGRSNMWLDGRAAEYVTGQAVAKGAQANANAVLVASGCMFAVKTSFLRAHPFDTRTMAEDMDLTWTAVEEGFNVAYVPSARCWVDDPYDWRTYRSQVSRWFRGYFQNIAVRRGNLFKRLRLGFVAYAYLAFNFIGFPLTLLAIYLAPLDVAKMMVLPMAILVGIMAWHDRNLWTGIRSVARMVALAPINYLIFIEAAWKELILRDKLSTWVKGH